jgi:hypothetical protein
MPTKFRFIFSFSIFGLTLLLGALGVFSAVVAENIGTSNVGVATNTPPVISWKTIVTDSASGTIPFSVNVADDQGIAGVRYLVDGVEQGAPVMKSPYSFNWFSTTTSNGPHKITAVAYDTEGNETITESLVDVENVTPTPKVEEIQPSLIWQASGGPEPKVFVGALSVPVSINNVACHSCGAISPSGSVTVYVTPWYANDGPESIEGKVRYGEQTFTIPSIPKGGSYNFVWNSSIKMAGHYYFVVVVDPENELNARRVHRSEFIVEK